MGTICRSPASGSGESGRAAHVRIGRRGRPARVNQVAHHQMDDLIESQRDDLFALGRVQFGVAAEQQFCLASRSFRARGARM